MAFVGTVVLIVACSGRDGGMPAAEPTPTVDATTTSVTEPPSTTPGGRGEITAAWQPHRLDPDGTTLHIEVGIPCGSLWEDIEATTTEQPDVVAVSVEAVELVQGFCEAADRPHPIEIALASPLGDRHLVDARDPGRELRWVVPPGWIQVRARLDAEDGAIGGEVPEDAILVLGHRGPQVPMSMSQVRRGVDAFLPFVVDPRTPIVGVYGFIDAAPLQPDAPMQGSITIPAPPSPDPRQELHIHLEPGAITMAEGAPVLDTERVAFTWRPYD